jgi:hypothetical protein
VVRGSLELDKVMKTFQFQRYCTVCSLPMGYAVQYSKQVLKNFKILNELKTPECYAKVYPVCCAKKNRKLTEKLEWEMLVLDTAN